MDDKKQAHDKRALPWMDLDSSLVHDAPAERSDQRLTSLSRRGFLTALGLGGVVSLSGCQRRSDKHALPLLEANEDSQPGVGVRYASTCLSCPAACGLLVTVRDGRPIKLEGNPDHPLSKGGLCARGQASVRGLYDAGRLTKPRLDGKDATWPQVDARVMAGLAAARGKTVVLSGSLVSPTTRAVVSRFLDKVGGKLVQYDSDLGPASAVREAYRLLDGKARYPAVSLEQVELLVSLGGDMLGAATEAVGFTRAYADRRRRRSEADFRHVHIEGNLSLTGAASDERVQATASERFAIAAALLRRLSAGTDGGEGPHAALIKTIAAPQTHAERLDDLVKRLSELPGRALVISGSRDPAEQALVVLINRALGAEGNALRLDLASAAHQGSDSAMAQLLADMKAGKVGALFVLDHNPVEQLPGGEALAKQIAALPLSVTLSARPTATADACKVVAAAHHPLERWSDAAPQPNVLSLAQPTIRPLFDTRDPMTSLLRWSGEKGSSYEQLRAEWKRAIDKPGGFEKLWDEALSSGTVPAEMATAIDDKGGTEPADVAPADAAALAKLLTARPAAAELEVELLEEVGRRDGSDGFNPWLVELPDPITRASWVATARLAPKLAKAKGIKNGDLVRISVGKTTAQMQARIVPGQHPKVIGLPVGYGMKDGVRVVRHGHRKKVDPSPKAVAEHNAYRLAALAPTGLRVAGLAATLERSGDKRSLPLMQWHSKTEGRPIVHQVLEPNGKIPAGHHGHHALWGDERKYSPSWHMTIDLDACTGCSACVIACQAENNIPVVGPDNMTDHRDMHWLRIDRYYMGSDDDPEVLFEPMLCAQCDNAPCETVCPVAATVHSHDGLNQQVYNRCVGTRYCANNCPYKVRRFNWFDFTPTDPLERLVLNPDVVVRDRGTMEKCTFCVQRIQGARIESKGDKRPLEVQTACQQSCPAKAIHFGDAHADPIVRKQTHEGRAFQVLDDLGVKPSVTYLARVRRRPQRPGDKT